MKEQLVSFETAKLAKEKGFNIRQVFMYDRNEEIQNTPGLKQIIKEGKRIDLKPPHQIFAPTQALLQKWLREEKEINVWAQLFVFDENRYGKEMTDGSYSFFIFKNNEFIIDDVDYKTFEECLEDGLKDALKLID